MAERKITLRCHLGVARFGVLDRIRIFLFGRVYVSVANPKAHTRVHLSAIRPVEHKRAEVQ